MHFWFRKLSFFGIGSSTTVWTAATAAVGAGLCPVILWAILNKVFPHWIICKNVGSFMYRLLYCTDSQPIAITPSPIRFEDKYKDRLRQLLDAKGGAIATAVHADKEKSDTKRCNFVMEPTPKGQAIMRYNKKSDTFEYYTDSGTLPHKYLETVCRKYVITFMCPHIYTEMDENDKISTASSPVSKKMARQNARCATAETAAFKKPIKTRINYFRRLGRLADCSILQTVRASPSIMSFADFKNQTVTEN
jgi:hypothetical protein